MIGVREIRSVVVDGVFQDDAQSAARVAAGKQSVERIVDGFW
jgi:FMN-dependent NADH-azoreductase